MGAAPRFWVSLPGRGKAVEMTAAELDERKRRGDLPAGTLIARFGTEEWVSTEAIEPLLVAARGEDEGRASVEPPISSSGAVEGVDAFEPPPAFAPTLIGESAAEEAGPSAPDPAPAPPPAAAAPKPEPKSRTVVLVLATAMIAMVASASVFWAWFRYGYARGSVLEHVPTDCRTLEYVDFAALDASPLVHGQLARRARALGDWAEGLDDDDKFRLSPDDDARGRVSVLRTIRRLGLEPYGDVKEMAYCAISDGGTIERITVLGGTFRGRDLVTAVREGLMRRDRKANDDRLQLTDLDGRPMLKLDDNRVLIMATGQIAMIGDRKVVSRFFGAKSTVRFYGVGDQDVLYRRWERKDGGTADEERYTLSRDKLVWVRTWATAPGDDVKAIRDRFAVTGDRFRKLDGFAGIADAYDNVEVKVEGSEGRSELVFPMKAATSAVTSLLDSDRKELDQQIAALKIAQGNEVFHHVMMPSVDYFDLKLSPW